MDIVEFLTSKEIIVVYIVAAVACLLCFIIYLVEKHNDRGKKRHNTRELNKLVEQIKEEVEITPEEEVKAPVLQGVEAITDEPSLDVEEVIEEIAPVDEVTPVEEIITEEVKPVVEEVVTPTTEVLEPINTVEDNDLEYTSIEPDINAAKEELYKITEELKEQEEKIEEVVENSSLTNYEVEQEENAIISLEELVKKSKEMYEANELTQYKDEGNEPISISELELRVGKEATPVTEPFVISNVVSEEELEEENEKIVLDDFNTIKTKVTAEPEVKRFKSSPIISPIYGIERKDIEVKNELELENTADYDKLDAEIKKTNEFLMTLKELQNKLD